MTRREKYRKGLHELYLPSYDLLCAELTPEWEPYQGRRAFFYQDWLYAQGRTSAGSIVTRARGGESPHNYGCATDWTVWKEKKPVWMGSADPKWSEYYDACEKIGLKRGVDFGDKPHNELWITVDWKEVHKVYLERGMQAAETFIKEKMK